MSSAQEDDRTFEVTKEGPGKRLNYLMVLAAFFREKDIHYAGPTESKLREASSLGNEDFSEALGDLCIRDKCVRHRYTQEGTAGPFAHRWKLADNTIIRVRRGDDSVFEVTKGGRLVNPNKLILMITFWRDDDIHSWGPTQEKLFEASGLTEQDAGQTLSRMYNVDESVEHHFSQEGTAGPFAHRWKLVDDVTITVTLGTPFK